MTPKERAVQKYLLNALEGVHERKMEKMDAGLVSADDVENGRAGYDLDYVAGPSSLPAHPSSAQSMKDEADREAKERLADSLTDVHERKMQKADGSMPVLKSIQVGKTYYVESDQGNIKIGGKRYFATNSYETVSLKGRRTTIDYDFQDKEFDELLKNALPEAGDDTFPLVYVYRESRNKKRMDQKKNLDQHTLYLFNGKLYNMNEAGNIIWGAAMQKMGFDFDTALTGAHFGALQSEHRLDEPYDQRAILEGWAYSNSRNPINHQRGIAGVLIPDSSTLLP